MSDVFFEELGVRAPDRHLGVRGDGFAEITSGLSEGDRVVTSANFLIDAESNLKAALQGMDNSGGGK